MYCSELDFFFGRLSLFSNDLPRNSQNFKMLTSIAHNIQQKLKVTVGRWANESDQFLAKPGSHLQVAVRLSQVVPERELA